MLSGSSPEAEDALLPQAVPFKTQSTVNAREATIEAVLLEEILSMNIEKYGVAKLRKNHIKGLQFNNC